MANIFISYSSADKTIVQKLSSLLESKGWTVWWDREIPIGQNFDLVIEKELNDSDCTLVIWTAKSVASQWVRAEAGEAAKKNKLVPIILENVEVPLAFRNMEAALLIGWNGEDEHPELELFYKAIKLKIGERISVGGNGNGKGNGNSEGNATGGGFRKPIGGNSFLLVKKYKIALLGIISLLVVIGSYALWKSKQVKHDYHISIIGKVKTASELPISHAEINVEGTKYYAISATDGTYKLNLDDFLPEEEITISTSHPDYEDKFFFFRPTSEEIKDFDIYLNPINLKKP